MIRRSLIFLVSLDPSRLATPNAGALPANRMAEVDAALRRALEL
jgi:mRNA-degrading endonuclease toxin of MazEF toxin-antitoxin module